MNDWEAQPRDFSFGRYLQEARLAQRIRLADLSRTTCIGIDNLVRLENDDLAHLPAEVFVVGYIRTYARAVDADPQEALRRYRICLEHKQKAAEWAARRARASRRFWPRLGLAVLVLAGLIATTIHFLAPNTPVPGGGAAPHVPVDLPSAGATDDSIAEAPSAAEVPADDALVPQKAEAEAAKPSVSNGGHRYQLDIWAVKDLWLKAIVDDQKAQVYKLKKGDTLHLEALTGINLLIEDSAGVELTLDGAALAIPGKAGQIVNLEIP